MPFKVPKEVGDVARTLTEKSFQTFLVGGCVRDLLLGREPKDWDIATDAKPTEIQKLFPDSVYENEFGTVLVKVKSEMVNGEKKSSFSIPYSPLNTVEVTTFRLEGRYTDKRHPDEVKFAKTIEEDLGRRDFTVNAIAVALSDKDTAESSPISHVTLPMSLVDPFGGKDDLKKKLIRAVGKAEDRFEEDALRLLRAVRFACELGFSIEAKTTAALKAKASGLEFVSKERIRDEFSKIIMSKAGDRGIEMLLEFGLLKYVVPELLEGVGMGQNKHHIFTVFEHNLKSLTYAVSKNFPLDLRIASLLHDVGKPRTKQGNGINSTFYGHQVVGERMAVKILDRLRYPKEMVEKVALLVREHMFVYDPETVTLAGVRRLIARVGKENVDDLLKIREADRIGSGVPKAQPYRLRYLKAMIEKVQQDPVHPKMLKIKGGAVMELLKIEPGPRVGKILAILLEEVLDDPTRNEIEILKSRVRELGRLSDAELAKLGEKADATAKAAQDRIDEEIKKKHSVG
ncbi:MAG: HD domain-containing protein [Patescibacteria group bacterium]